MNVPEVVTRLHPGILPQPDTPVHCWAPKAGLLQLTCLLTVLVDS